MIKLIMKIIGLIWLCAFLLFGCSDTIPEFSGEKAFDYLEAQCDFGPKNPGSEGHMQCKDYFIDFLNSHGAKVSTQEFPVEIREETFQCTNIIASYYPEKPRRIFIGAHWDTRPWADRDADITKHNTPIIGANDAASGIAVLMELATILQTYEPTVYGIDLLFFDAEDAGSYGANETWCLGSEYFAENYTGKEPEYVVVIDMIGDADLDILIESFSQHSAPELVKKVWDIAKKNDIRTFSLKMTGYIYDDHYAFLEAGYEAIDIIDMEYPYWHTIEDTPDKCSAESLQDVGTVLTHLIYE